MPVANEQPDSEISENDINVSLMLRVKAGDLDAFEKLVELHQHIVIGTVVRMLGSNMDAEDIAQQVFIRLWKSAPRYKVKAKFTTFLYTITKNLVFNESRRRSRKKEYSLEQKEAESFHDLEDRHASSPAQDIIQSELQSQVDEAIASLPEIQRMVVVLRRYENMPYEEMSTVLGVSVSAVKSHLFRARAALREKLNKYL